MHQLRIRKISFAEWNLLLVLAGVEGLQGIFPPEQSLEKKDLLYVAHHFRKNGWITLREEQILLQGEMQGYGEFFRTVKSQWYVESAYGLSTEQGMLYGNDKVYLWMLPCKWEPDKFEMQWMTQSQWIDWLVEKQYVPLRKEQKYGKKGDWQETQEDAEEIYFSIEKKTGISFRLLVGQWHAKEYIWKITSHSKEWLPYDTEKIRYVLQAEL